MLCTHRLTLVGRAQTRDALLTAGLGSWGPSPWASWAHIAAHLLSALGYWVLSRCRGSAQGPGAGGTLSFRFLQPVASKPGAMMEVSYGDSAV